ncbi:MAG: tRNA (adenosine(37)-N6)-dimethylallyltransferase MiaA [Oscillospiraceae bacterium]|nr:tRNA (adenosine(37)-N6)-dimethylallyltransferase MiaA [Oscillospiraceae bacterium]
MAAQVVVITGPTAAGKTGLGVRLAQAIGGEVVSADSMQIYRGMDIGTAKPGALEMGGVPHHMIDVAEPDEAYSVARYVEEASRCVDDILARGKVPILVGGTGLYIDSLLSGREFAPQRVGSGMEDGGRTQFAPAEDIAPLQGRGVAGSVSYDAEACWQELQAIDPETAGRLHPNDRKRVLRALEVYRLTGQTMTAHNEATKRIPPRYAAVKIAITARDRADLYRRIDCRVDGMVAAGLQAEVERLIQSGLSAGSTAMQAIGYKEMLWAVKGELSAEEAVARIKQESRRYAKRQLSWIGRDETVRWIIWDKEPDLEAAAHSSTEFCREVGVI